MKKLLDKMLIPQDKANHFVWTVVILTCVFGGVAAVDALLDAKVNFFIMVGFSFVATAVIGLIKEIRDYTTGKGTPSFLDVLANLYALLTVFGLITFTAIAYK